MRRIKVIDRASDKHAARKKERGRKRAIRRHAHQGRKAKIGKIIGCIALLAFFALLGFLVGNDEYRATLIGWVPFVMALVGILLAWLYLRVLKHGIRYEERLSMPECERDSDVVFTMNFKNRTPLLATRMKSTFFISDMFDNIASENSTTLSLAPFEDYDLSLTTRFEHIGTFHAGLKEIVVADFLGLFTYTISNRANQVVQVMPKVIELEGIRFSNEAMDEAMKAAKSVLADSMDYAMVREYEIGDPLKTIHWNLSARAGKYMTRLFEVYTNPSVVIILDFYAPSDEAEDLMSMYDAIVESGFALSRYARKRGMETEIHFRDKYGIEQTVYSVDQAAASEVVADLPRMSNDPRDASGALDILHRQVIAPRGFNNIFVCTANVGAEMVSGIVEARVRRRSPTMVAVIPPSLVGREREDWCANLSRLESTDIAYSIISRSDELGVVVGGDR